MSSKRFCGWFVPLLVLCAFGCRRLPPIRAFGGRLADECPVFAALGRFKVGNLSLVQWPPKRIALEVGPGLFCQRVLVLVERFPVGTSARTWIGKLDGIVFPSAYVANLVRAI